MVNDFGRVLLGCTHVFSQVPYITLLARKYILGLFNIRYYPADCKAIFTCEDMGKSLWKQLTDSHPWVQPVSIVLYTLYWIIIMVIFCRCLCNMNSPTGLPQQDIESGRQLPLPVETKVLMYFKDIKEEEEDEGFCKRCCPICLEAYEDDHEIRRLKKCRHILGLQATEAVQVVVLLFGQRDAQHLQQLPSGAGSQHTQAGQIGRLGPVGSEYPCQENFTDVPLGIEGTRAALLCDKGIRSSRERTMSFTKMDFPQ
ncbi:unnamed protein product [Thlaspi arvense]|uniref:Uncharacterized protein n=1 Tax=Thlaspi arvense TaxID=13288 RepID=A0AAU9RBX7_THLAR|nr:unnamed protein product [Thlaspi arvense]